jgi:hypothetical protein
VFEVNRRISGESIFFFQKNKLTKNGSWNCLGFGSNFRIFDAHFMSGISDFVAQINTVVCSTSEQGFVVLLGEIRDLRPCIDYFIPFSPQFG